MMTLVKSLIALLRGFHFMMPTMMILFLLTLPDDMPLFFSPMFSMLTAMPYPEIFRKSE